MHGFSLNEITKFTLQMAREGAVIADDLFAEEIGLSEKGPHGDLVTHADYAIQEHIAAGLEERFPDIPVVAEEGPTVPAGGLHFVVDPLDGTNNFAIGIPCYAVTVSVVADRTPIAASVVQGQTSRWFTAIGTDGIQINCMRWSPPDRLGTASRAALWLGYGTGTIDQSAHRMRETLNSHCSRVLETWSPASDLFAALNGSLHLVVGMRCSGMEIPAAIATFRAMGWETVTPSGSPLIDVSPELDFVAGQGSEVSRLLAVLDGTSTFPTRSKYEWSSH